MAKIHRTKIQDISLGIVLGGNCDNPGVVRIKGTSPVQGTFLLQSKTHKVVSVNQASISLEEFKLPNFPFSGLADGPIKWQVDLSVSESETATRLDGGLTSLVIGFLMPSIYGTVKGRMDEECEKFRQVLIDNQMIYASDLLDWNFPTFRIPLIKNTGYPGSRGGSAFSGFMLVGYIFVANENAFDTPFPRLCSGFRVRAVDYDERLHVADNADFENYRRVRPSDLVRILSGETECPFLDSVWDPTANKPEAECQAKDFAKWVFDDDPEQLIDEDAQVRRSEDGFWVQTWFRVSDLEMEEWRAGKAL